MRASRSAAALKTERTGVLAVVQEQPTADRLQGICRDLQIDDELVIADTLTQVKARHGTLSVLYHKGNGSFAGLKIMGERFFNLYGGVTQAVGRFCGGEADYGTNQSFGSVESVKAVSDIYSPVSGEVTDINKSLADAPEKLNKDPHGGAWLIKIRVSDSGEIVKLLSAADYQNYIGAEK